MSGTKKRRAKITLEDTDVALVFRKEGVIEASFPEITSEPVPDHVVAAMAVSYALVDEDFFNSLRERFSHKLRALNLRPACNDL